ncbi:MAG TPA: SDR family oxidoreductase [Phycisphaerae bacterium]|nr:SDR family oxidoreductase [Phycisphaerae bacterium]
MANRTAIVTGAGTGIGRATALRLARQGFAVALVGRTAATLEWVAREIVAMRGESMVVVADVSKWDAVEGMVRAVVQRWGRVDVLVNNAGMAPSVAVAEMEPALWREILDANLSSAFYATRAVWGVMQKNGGGAGGVIVNISSMAAKDPFPGLGAYAVAKIGVNMLSLASAREGDAVGIRVVAIAPGAVETQMLRKLVDEKSLGAEHVMAPDDVAAAILDVVDGSLRHCSGETIYLHRRAT